MLVYKGTNNLSEKQIETGCGSILMRITKKTAVDTLVKFFSDDDLNGSDKMTARYVSRGIGQIALIPSLPMFPLAVGCTTGPNHIIAIEDTAGNIKTVELTIQFGVNGALKLDGNTSISLMTNISDLEQLEVYSIDGVPTDLCYVYNTIIAQGGAQRDVNLRNVNKIILDPMVTGADLISSGGYTVNLAQAEIDDISQGLNDVVALRGKEITYTRKNNGDTYPVKTGIEATKTYTGGTFYPVLGVANYEVMKNQCF